MRRLPVIAVLVASMAGACAQRLIAAVEVEVVGQAQTDRAAEVLRDALARESRWAKVHAAEHLLTLGYPQGVRAAFVAEQAAHESEPEYRIGIWRVLAQSAPTSAARQAWIERIEAVLADPAAADHTHALESFAKLGVRVDEPKLRDAVVKAAGAGQRTAPYARWLLAVDDQSALPALAELLDSAEPNDRLVAAYALEKLRPADAAIRQQLRTTAEHEPADSPARPYLLSAAWQLAADESLAQPFREALLTEGNNQRSPSQRAAICAALAARGGPADVPALETALDDSEADVRTSAAAALLRIGRRATHVLTWLDGGVIGLYFVGMLAIGWYYSLRTKNDEDYLLGNRQMKPWAVGLSLFATITSTISYLSTPGEMIQHGPMYFSSILAYPVIAVVVGWMLIPYFVKVPMTSAYEILETRLGLGVRLLGALFFLSLRLLWMAVIIDATTRIVLVPLLGLEPSAIPYISVLLGLTTVIYTSIGGIRAVVATDVAQTFILLAGAIVTLALVTWQLGGTDAWWPTTWAENWDPPTIGYDPLARISLMGALVSTFFWHVCTSGSDQMAIQRYLATRDAASARRMFNISLIAGAVVTVLLALVGLSLLAWFREHPDMLGDGQSVARDADQLFPRFIAVGLPSGLGGLVVAGLLSAAMSSLSSGLNSSCAVITVDLIDRFGGRERLESEELRRTRLVAWCVGLAVVLLSTVVGVVQGNLLEVAFKVVNLLVAPLFGLFFMALFVPWSTSFGTFVGAAFGLAAVVAINYWQEFTGRPGISFLWGMPLGLLVQTVAGSLASLLPIGRRSGRHDSLQQTN